jgi:hypothetical protein
VDNYAIFYPEKIRKEKVFQAFGSTVQRTKAKTRPEKQISNKVKKGQSLLSRNATFGQIPDKTFKQTFAKEEMDTLSFLEDIREHVSKQSCIPLFAKSISSFDQYRVKLSQTNPTEKVYF